MYGPRQVGKTTMVMQLQKQLAYDSMFVAADDVPAVGGAWIQLVWSEARRKLQDSGGKDFLLIIDEVQKIDNWSKVVKKEWDADTREGRNLKVIILGSSRLLIQQGLTESLAGRFEATGLTHWTYAEMREAFGWSVDRYMWFGGYPGAAGLADDEPRWRAYVKDALIETSISKDILMLTRVEKPALLKRLFEIGCSHSSQIVALNKVQGELQESGNLTTLAGYLHLLEGSGLLAGLEKYSGNVLRKRSSKPKFQVFNNALLSTQANVRFEQAKANHKLWGRVVESAVGAHLLNASIAERFAIYYWNSGDSELDFVLEKEGKLIAVEVKSGADSYSKGLSLFSQAYSPNHIFTVGTGGMPVEEFLLSSPASWFEL